MTHTRKTFSELSWVFAGRVALVRRDMGLSSFGVQLFDFRPGDDGPPEHDEAASGQIVDALDGNTAPPTVGDRVYAQGARGTLDSTRRASG